MMRRRMIKEMMDTRMMKRTNLSRTFPAEVLNVSTTAALLSTTGQLLHTIQDWPEKKSFFLNILLSKTFKTSRIGLRRNMFSKKAWLDLKGILEAFQRKSNTLNCYDCYIWSHECAIPTILRLSHFRKIKGGSVFTCSRCIDKVVPPSPSPPRQEAGSTRPGKIFWELFHQLLFKRLTGKGFDS